MVEAPFAALVRCRYVPRLKMTKQADQDDDGNRYAEHKQQD